VNFLAPCHEEYLNLSTPEEVSKALLKAAASVA
jgi:hypothetical protein